MRRVLLNVLAATLLVAGVFAGLVPVQAMDGNGSPWGQENCGGYPQLPNQPNTCTPVAQPGVAPGGLGTYGGYPNAVLRPTGYEGTCGAVAVPPVSSFCKAPLPGDCLPTPSATPFIPAPAVVSEVNCTYPSAAPCVPFQAHMDTPISLPNPNPCAPDPNPGGNYSIFYPYSKWPIPPAEFPTIGPWQNHCMMSPQCIPYPAGGTSPGSPAPWNTQNPGTVTTPSPSQTWPAYSISNPFWSMGPPQQAPTNTPVGPSYLRYRTPNPCLPIGYTPYPVIGGSNDNSPLAEKWNPIESMQNLHATTNKYVAVNSISRTPFRGNMAPPATPGYDAPYPGTSPGEGPYSPNPWGADEGGNYVYGNGRFHVDATHIYNGVVQASGQQPPEDVDNTTVNGSTLKARGDPGDMEGAPDLNYTVLGNDGYALGRWQTPVQNLPGFDFNIAQVVLNPGPPMVPTTCVYGASNPQGPFTLVHSAFNTETICDTTLETTMYCPARPKVVDPSISDGLGVNVGGLFPPDNADPCPSVPPPAQMYCWYFDLDLFYEPLRKLCGPTCTGGLDPGRMDYFMVVSSFSRTPYLKTDFSISPVDNARSCVDMSAGQYGYGKQATPDGSNWEGNSPIYGYCPDPPAACTTCPLGYYPYPQRNYVFNFDDTSVRFGFPIWQTNNPIPFVDNIGDIHADPIAEWNWDFTGDPYAIKLMWDEWQSNWAPPGAPPLNMPPRPNGRVDTVYCQPYVAPECLQLLPPADQWWIRQNMTTPTGPMVPITEGTEKNQTHLFVSPGIFPVCESTHTNDQIIDGLDDYMYIAHWRQSDPPASDKHRPAGAMRVSGPSPTMPQVEHWAPFPNRNAGLTGSGILLPLSYTTYAPFAYGGMLCKPVTVYNAPPLPSIAFEPSWQDPLRFTFHDLSTDPDWLNPLTFDEDGRRVEAVTQTQLPPEERKMHPNPFLEYYGAPICGDCPPDGISVRVWDFMNDGFTPGPSGTGYGGHCMPSLPAPNCNTYTTPAGDLSWRFLSRTLNDVYTWDPTFPMDSNGSFTLAACSNTIICPWFFGWNTPTATNGIPYGNYERVLHSEGASFRLQDVGATVGGFGIQNGTKIVRFIDTKNVLVNKDLQPSFVSMATDPVTVACSDQPSAAKAYCRHRWPLTVSISWPYNSDANMTDNPAFTYSRPGDYTLNYRVCDHEYMVTKSTNTWSGVSRVMGDALNLKLLPSAPTPSWAPPLPTDPAHNLIVTAAAAVPTGAQQLRSMHACSGGGPNGGGTIGPDGTWSGLFHVNIPNHAPHIALAPAFVVRVGGTVTFRVTGSDSDFGQVLSMRLCPGQNLPPEINFPEVTTLGAGRFLNHTFSWDMDGLPVGTYGPICFEITDGIAITHRETTIFVAGESTDTDGDGIIDLSDNCPGTPNADQADGNRDGIGDACQDSNLEYDATAPKPADFDPNLIDQDLDLVADERDNCLDFANRDQSDIDGDSLGDICDEDSDGDGVANGADNCPLRPNPRQEDSNNDGGGDICIGWVFNSKGAGLPGLAEEPETASDATWTLILGSGLGIVAMVGVLVPLLLFALRRHQRGKGEE